jgi:hypothetical protein
VPRAFNRLLTAVCMQVQALTSPKPVPTLALEGVDMDRRTPKAAGDRASSPFPGPKIPIPIPFRFVPLPCFSSDTFLVSLPLAASNGGPKLTPKAANLARFLDLTSHALQARGLRRRPGAAAHDPVRDVHASVERDGRAAAPALPAGQHGPDAQAAGGGGRGRLCRLSLSPPLSLSHTASLPGPFLSLVSLCYAMICVRLRL